MKIFGRYYSYQLKRSALKVAILTVIAVIIAINAISSGITDIHVKYQTTNIYVFAVILGILCTMIPVLELAGFKNRRNLDTLYFFPIKRWKMAAVHYLSGLTQIFAIYSVAFFSGYAYLAMRTDSFELGYMIPYYFLSLLLGIVMYSVFMFVFEQANTVADGALFILLWVFVLFIVAWVMRVKILRPFIADTMYWIDSAGDMSWGIVYMPINNLTVIFKSLIEVNRVVEYDYTLSYAQQYMGQIYMFFIWGAFGVAAAIGYFITFVRKGAQCAGEISDSWFGYKTLIPVYGYSLLMMYNDFDIMTLLIVILMISGYVIYRRSFKLKKSDIAVMCSGVVAIILAYLIV